MRPGGSALLFNVKTIEGDEKKHALIVPRSHLFMPLIKLKKNVVQGLQSNTRSPQKKWQKKKAVIKGSE